MLSLEVSTITLCCMSIERAIAIVFPFLKIHPSMKKCICGLLFVWFVGVIIAALPLLVYNIYDYYGSNGVCLPLHTQYPYSMGWLYSALVFIGLNTLVTIIVIVCYTRIVVLSVKSSKQSNSSINRDAALAKRTFMIVFTNVVCWVPLVIVKILALTLVPISPVVYGWLSIFILSVNSAVNPFIYTFTTDAFQRKIQGMLTCHTGN